MTAVIFDLDGVLVDSEPLWQAGFAAVTNTFCDERGLPHEELRADDMVRFHGGRVRDTLGALLEELGHPDVADSGTLAMLTDRVVDQVSEEFDQTRDAIGPSVEVARRLAQDDVRMAVASSSAQRFIESVVSQLELGDAFEVIQSALELEHGKPHPEVYELTLDRLGVSAEHTLAIEDSIPGVASALRAGLRCVWLRPTPASTEDRAMAELTSTLTEGGVEDLDECLARVLLVTSTLTYSQIRHVMREVG